MSVCVKCGSAKIAPSHQQRPHPWCSRCLNASPGGKAARRRWMARNLRRRIRISSKRDAGFAATPERAAQINAYIKERKRALVTRFAAGAEAKSRAAGAISPETEHRSD